MPKKQYINGSAIVEWLATMKERKLASSDAAAARMLGISANSMADMKRRGADRRTALACAYLMREVKQ